MSWKMMAAGRNYPDNFEEELEAAYQKGCEHGYQKAKEEMEGGEGYGERRYDNYPMYSERRQERGYDSEGYGERRGVRRYSRR